MVEFIAMIHAPIHYNSVCSCYLSDLHAIFAKLNYFCMSGPQAEISRGGFVGGRSRPPETLGYLVQNPAIQQFRGTSLKLSESPVYHYQFLKIFIKFYTNQDFDRQQSLFNQNVDFNSAYQFSRGGGGRTSQIASNRWANFGPKTCLPTIVELRVSSLTGAQLAQNDVYANLREGHFVIISRLKKRSYGRGSGVNGVKSCVLAISWH